MPISRRVEGTSLDCWSHRGAPGCCATGESHHSDTRGAHGLHPVQEGGHYGRQPERLGRKADLWGATGLWTSSGPTYIFWNCQQCSSPWNISSRLSWAIMSWWGQTIQRRWRISTVKGGYAPVSCTCWHANWSCEAAVVSSPWERHTSQELLNTGADLLSGGGGGGSTPGVCGTDRGALGSGATHTGLYPWRLWKRYWPVMVGPWWICLHQEKTRSVHCFCAVWMLPSA